MDTPATAGRLKFFVPTSLYSTSHAISTWSRDTTIDFAWTGAHDGHSGLDGYGLTWSTSPALPGAVKDVEETPAAYTVTAATSTRGQYLSMRAVDNAANWEADYISTGPFLIDAVAPGPPTGLASVTHPAGSCTTDAPGVTVTWVAATDAHSGIDGYSYVVSASSTRSTCA